MKVVIFFGFRYCLEFFVFCLVVWLDVCNLG